MPPASPLGVRRLAHSSADVTVKPAHDAELILSQPGRASRVVSVLSGVGAAGCTAQVGHAVYSALAPAATSSAAPVMNSESALTKNSTLRETASGSTHGTGIMFKVW